MKRSATGFTPDFRKLVGDPQAEIPKHLLDLDGVRYLVAHCQRASIGVVASDGGTVNRLAIHLFQMPPAPISTGIALMFTPGIEEARALGERLLRMADMLEAEAATAADAAITRAREVRS